MLSLLRGFWQQFIKYLTGPCRFSDPLCKAYHRGGVLTCTCGKTSKPSSPAPPPTAPSPQETSQQAIQAQIEAVPQILDTQKQFGPQFTQLDLDNLRQFGPQFLEEALKLSQQFGPGFAEQTRAEQAILAPERVVGSQQLAEFLEAGPEGLSPEEERFIREQRRSADASRGLAESGFSAREELNNLFEARQRLKSRFLNVALSSSGRLPAAGGQTVAAPNVQQGQLVQNVTPSQIFGAQQANQGFAANIFGTQAGIFGNQLSNQTARRGQNFGLLGSDAASLGTAKLFGII